MDERIACELDGADSGIGESGRSRVEKELLAMMIRCRLDRFGLAVLEGKPWLFF